MKSNISIVTMRGQISIPADIRRKAGIKPGERLFWECDETGAVRVQKTEEPTIRGAEQMRGFAKNFRKVRSTEEWMKDLRAGESL